MPDHIDRQNETQRRLKDFNVVDNLIVRTGLLERVQAGEISLKEAQHELKQIQRNAKRNNKPTVYGTAPAGEVKT